MNIFSIVGMNIDSADKADIEAFALKTEDYKKILGQLYSNESVYEILYLATSNRVEYFLWHDEKLNPKEALKEVYSANDLAFDDAKVETIDNILALTHVFRLPLGLDSRDVGETEIKFQLTNAFEKALGHGFAGNYLIKLISKVLLISKKIRNKTGLFPIGRTVAGAAVKIIKDHSDRKTKIIIIGENKDAKDLYRKLLYNKYRKVRYFYDADDFRNKFIFEEELFVVVFVADNIIESVEAILETLADYTNIILITNAELNKVKHPGNVQLFEKNRVSTFLENEKIKQQRIVSEAEKHIQLEIQNFIMQ